VTTKKLRIKNLHSFVTFFARRKEVTSL
jgi:hypothetical protein